VQPKFIMIICFDIGGSAIKSAVAHSAGEIRQTGSVATPLHDLDLFVHAIAGLIEAAGAPEDAAVAIAIAGVVDEEDVIKVANIPCIDGLRLKTVLSEALGRRVAIVNDADAFALAEAGQGAGKGRRIVFGAILGTGVGGGLVIDGRLVRGAGGFAGEWGHGPLGARLAGEPSVLIPSLACGCGQSGCVDTLGGARGLERLHAILHGVERSSREIVADWEAGEPLAGRTIDIFIELLAGPLALVVNVVGADIVPVGGGLSNSTRLIEHLDGAVRARILRKTVTPLVVPALCRIEPGLIGAAIAGFQETINDAA
jgi:N-acetylglucosamine kinase